MSKQAKDQRWEQIAARVDQITDALGTPVDPGIRETVIALNVLGICTTASCEGHSSHGTGGPYIRVQAPRTAQVQDQANEAARTGDDARLFELAHQTRTIAREDFKGLYDLLERFYSVHSKPYDVQLVLSADDFGQGVLQSHGASFQVIREPELQHQKLQTYQEEMAAFAAFLKQLGEGN